MKKKLVLGGLAAAAFSLGTAFTAVADPPPVGSEQWNKTREYKDFIVNMRTENGGSCCDLSDGRAELEERYVVNEKGEGNYVVTVTREIFEDSGTNQYRKYSNFIPPEGKPVIIPNHKVLTPEFANKVCEPHRQQNPDTHTCKPPPFNILWMSTGGYVYCYWPQPTLF